MRKPTPSVEELILRIHAAPLQRDGWQTVARDMMALVGANRAILLKMGATPQERPWAVPLEFNPEVLKGYMDHWAPEDVMFHGAVRSNRVRPGCVSTEEELVDRTEYLETAYFNEFLKPADIERQLNLCLTAPDARLGLGPSAMTLYRPVGDAPFSRAEAGVARSLMRHLSLAARTTFVLHTQEAREHLCRGALGSIAAACLGVDRRGGVLFASPAAEKMMQSQQYLASRHGVLRATGQGDEPMVFQKLLAALREGRGGSMMMHGDAREPVTVTAVPLRPGSEEAGQDRVAVGILWVVPVENPPSSIERLSTLFALSAAECRLLKKLVAGVSVNEAAAALNRSVHTTRTQLKSILRKTGRHSQAQLLTLVARMSMIDERVTE